MSQPEQKPFTVSDWPTPNKDLDPSDYVSVVSSRDAFFTEQMVRNQELKVLRHKLRWCYRREGVNHLENCRFLATQYLEFIKEGMFKPWKTPAPVKE